MSLKACLENPCRWYVELWPLWGGAGISTKGDDECGAPTMALMALYGSVLSLREMPSVVL